MKYRLLVAVITFLITACEENFVMNGEENPPLVIEGWMAEGENPVVMVTHAVALDKDSVDVSGFIEKWGRVSICDMTDGERQYLLTGRVDNGYLPSLIFTNTRLKGIPGHEYRLKVETEQGNAEACAELLADDVSIELLPEMVEGNDSTFTIRARVENPEPDACYKFYVKVVGQETHFYPAFKATFLGRDFPADGFVITRMQRIQFDEEAENRFSHFFTAGDVVQVRLCRIPTALYEFWRIYDNTVALGSNMLLTFAENCPGNVEGAYGYWQPEGAVTKVIRIPEP